MKKVLTSILVSAFLSLAGCSAIPQKDLIKLSNGYSFENENAIYQTKVATAAVYGFITPYITEDEFISYTNPPGLIDLSWDSIEALAKKADINKDKFVTEKEAFNCAGEVLNAIYNNNINQFMNE